MRCTILNYFVVLSIEFAKIRGRKASEAWHTAFGVSKDISILKRENHGHFQMQKYSGQLIKNTIQTYLSLLLEY